MVDYLSPQVDVKEKDLSVSVPAVSTTTVAMVGKFTWGPCYERTFITQDSELLDNFYKPNDNVYEDWFSAWNVLQYNNSLYIVRAINDASATNGGMKLMDSDAADPTPVDSAALIQNDEAAENYTPSFSGDEKWHILAKYPGTRGNDLKIAVSNYTDFSTANIRTGVTFASEFEFGPEDTSQVAIVVMDAADSNIILERWIVSLTQGAKNFEGTNIYCEDYINSQSKYILLYNNTDNTTEIDSFEGVQIDTGVDGFPSNGDITSGYELFENPEEIDISMIIDGANCNATVQGYIVDNICEVRKDCVGIFSIPKADVVAVTSISTAVSNIVTYLTSTLNKSTSWASLYANWKYQYDSYADKYRWVPVSGDLAGITARTHFERDPWFAPAFYNRGIMKNAKKIAINPKKAHRDVIYKNAGNPIINSPGNGIVVLGQKTLYAAPSSFNRLDVRWLFLVMEKAIAISAKYIMGEKNNDFTRRQFKGIVEPYLRNIKGREGIEDFYVQVDENVNTPEVVQRNEFRGVIYIKPTMTAEFIVLEFVNVRQGISFDEVVKKAE